MSSDKKEEKSQVAADRIKAAALTAAKGLSRAQAERAATAAARNVNAYGQKEEGPSRWQERKEAKRQMYLMSTEKAVKLGVRKDSAPKPSGVGGAAQCQKCYQTGHWTYECKNDRVYISRPSRSQQLKNPARTRIVVSFEGNPDVEERKDGKERRKRKHDSENESSEASVFESESESESESSESSSSSDSEERGRRRRRKQKKRQHRRRSSSSSSESESESDSSSDGEDAKRKTRRRNKRR